MNFQNKFLEQIFRTTIGDCWSNYCWLYQMVLGEQVFQLVFATNNIAEQNMVNKTIIFLMSLIGYHTRTVHLYTHNHLLNWSHSCVQILFESLQIKKKLKFLNLTKINKHNFPSQFLVVFQRFVFEKHPY